MCCLSKRALKPREGNYYECSLSDLLKQATYLLRTEGYIICQKNRCKERWFLRWGNYVGKPMEFKLINESGAVIPKEKLYVPYYHKNCDKCGGRFICNGCDDCGKCRE